MTKFTKLINNPKLFFIDALKNIVIKFSNFFKKKEKNNQLIFKKFKGKKDNLFYEYKNDFFEYFENENPDELNEKLLLKEKNFLYFNFNGKNEDAIFAYLREEESYNLLPFNVVRITENQKNMRWKIRQFIEKNPDLYIRLLIKRLVQIKDKVTSILFLNDHLPESRILVDVCRILEIPTILIPYTYSFDLIPQTDLILGSGDFQKKFLDDKGFDIKYRFQNVGNLKLDLIKNFNPQISGRLFRSIFCIPNEKKICLFFLSYLNNNSYSNQIITNQLTFLKDVHKKCLENNLHLLLIIPKGNAGDYLDDETFKIIEDSNISTLENSINSQLGTLEYIYHCDLIISIDTKILFEAVFLQKPVILSGYDSNLDNQEIISFNSNRDSFFEIINRLGLPYPSDFISLSEAFDLAFDNSWFSNEQVMEWLKSEFGIGVFDGKASERIRCSLSSFTSDFKINKKTVFQKILDDQVLDFVAIPSSRETLEEGTQKYLKNLINASRIVSTQEIFNNKSKINKLSKYFRVDVFIHWGIALSKSKSRQDKIAKRLLKPSIFLEDGFIRSLDLGVTGNPGHSVIIDDIAPYYDSLSETRLQKLLNSSKDLSFYEFDRCRKLINLITKYKITKYNHAPIYNLKIGSDDKPKILLVDQRYGDNSVSRGLGDTEIFENMLNMAIEKYPGYEIIIKLHPDATSGIKKSYFNRDILRKFSKYKNIYTLSFDINPYSVFNEVDKVFVCSSGLGFEALMAGKEVHCFGVPYYANRGLTIDYQRVEHRRKNVSLEIMFYYTYIYLSRYVNPKTGERCSLEELLKYFIKEIHNFNDKTII